MQFSSAEWRTNQLVALAEVFKEPLTAECLALYVESLADLSDDQIRLCVRRAIRELKWFPKPVELRDLAGANVEDEVKIEAEAAWQFANRYLEKFGVVRYCLDDRAPLSARIEYALRRIGGLRGLNQVTEGSRPFMFRDFCEGYRQAPLADSLAPRLAEIFGRSKLLAQEHNSRAAKSAGSLIGCSGNHRVAGLESSSDTQSNRRESLGTKVSPGLPPSRGGNRERQAYHDK